jgi:radical SAM superfamily enzyme YgiQ (UPF0313 family)
MKVHLINPSDVSFGTAVITPRWMYVIAAATPASFGDPLLADETLHPFDSDRVQSGDVVGISIHTENALRGYQIGKISRDRGAFVIFGGIHATLYPEEARSLGGAQAVVMGDGEMAWPTALADCRKGAPQSTYLGGRVEASNFLSARWDLAPRDKYMWASVQTVRGCPKHCSFCSVWKTDGQRPRQRPTDGVIEEIVQLRRLGFRFVLLADDNFYPVTLTDLQLASRQGNTRRLEELKALRAERFDLMARLALLPSDMVFFTQITMEAAEDPCFLDAMRKANIKGALVGVESVTPAGLKDVYKDFNSAGEGLVERLRTFRQHNVHVLGSFIFGLPSDRPATFEATAAVAQRAEIAFAQFVMLTPFPGTVDFAKWEKMTEGNFITISGVPLTRRWLIPERLRPKVYWPHPVMSAEEIRRRTQFVWDRFYSLKLIWKRSSFIKSLRNRLAFVLISKVYLQMYANTGMATDSARVARSVRWARWMAKPCRYLFSARPMPQLEVPNAN